MLALSSSRCAMASVVRVQPARVMLPTPLSRGAMVVEAAVPKKKMSKSKKNIRKAAWKAKVLPYAEKAFFLAKLALQQGDGARESKDKDMTIKKAEEAPAEGSQ